MYDLSVHKNKKKTGATEKSSPFCFMMLGMEEVKSKNWYRIS